jgi:hypothetical protein
MTSVLFEFQYSIGHQNVCGSMPFFSISIYKSRLLISQVVMRDPGAGNETAYPVGRRVFLAVSGPPTAAHG